MNNLPGFSRFSHSFQFSIIALVLLSVGVILAVSISQQQQDNRSSAAIAPSNIILLSQGKATTSSGYSSGKPPSLAVDGNFTSYWEADSDNNEWVSVDLGAPYTITSVKLFWKDTYASSYKIQVSNDQVSWVTAYTKSGGNGGNETVTLSGNPIGRYVRMQGVQKNGLFGYKLYEMQVFGGISPTSTPLVTAMPTQTSSLAPTATLSGLASGIVGAPLTYSALVSGTRIVGGEIYVSPIDTESWTKLSGSTNSCTFTSTCSTSGSWTPTTAGQYYVVINGYSDSNGNSTINEPGETCSGNPFGLPTGWADCGSSDRILVTIATTATATPIPTACANVNPTGWWKAEGNANNTDTNNHAVVNSGVTYTAGKVGQGFNFNGTSGYAQLPTNFFPYPSTAPFSFDTWFKTSSGGVILGQQLGAPPTNQSAYVPAVMVGTDGKLYVEMFWTGVRDQIISSVAVNDGNYHHVGVTYNGTIMSAYLDGVLIGTKSPVTQTSYGIAYNYQLGTGYSLNWLGGNSGWYYFNGILDEASVYNTALSLGQIQSIYASGTTGKCAVFTPIPTATTVPTSVPTSIPTLTSVPPTATTMPIVTSVPTTVLTSIPTVVASNTPTPTGIVLAFNLLLHGLGNGGDSVNPNGQGNFDLLHPQRSIEVQVFNAANQLIQTQQATAIFNTGTGKFGGTVSLGTTLGEGVYTVKVKGSQLLRTQVPGILNIAGTQLYTLPDTALVTGDINNDNQVNILDYNLLTGCYSDFLPAANCTVANKALADLTDDGNVNQFDYNLFLRELSNVTGQ